MDLKLINFAEVCSGPQPRSIKEILEKHLREACTPMLLECVKAEVNAFLLNFQRCNHLGLPGSITMHVHPCLEIKLAREILGRPAGPACLNCTLQALTPEGEQFLLEYYPVLVNGPSSGAAVSDIGPPSQSEE